MTNEEALLQLRNDVANYLNDKLIYQFDDKFPFIDYIEYDDFRLEINIDKYGRGFVRLHPKNREGDKIISDLKGSDIMTIHCNPWGYMMNKNINQYTIYRINRT